MPSDIINNTVVQQPNWAWSYRPWATSDAISTKSHIEQLGKQIENYSTGMIFRYRDNAVIQYINKDTN